MALKNKTKDIQSPFIPKLQKETLFYHNYVHILTFYVEILYAVKNQISILFTDNKDSVFCMHELHNNENEHRVSRLPEVSYVQQSSAILVPAHRAGFQGCSGHGCRVLHHVVQVFIRGGQPFHLRLSSTADNSISKQKIF